MAGTSAHGGRGHEKRDISIRAAAFVTLGILAAAPLVLWAMSLFFDYLAERERRSQPTRLSEVPTEANPLPPEPRLQMSPAQEYRKVRDEEKAALGSYGWVDRNAGKVRIPVARAIDLLAERGLPVRTGSERSAPAATRGGPPDGPKEHPAGEGR